MQRWGKRFLWLGVLALIALATLTVFFITIPSHKISQSLSAELSQSLHSEVVIGKAEIHLFPRPHYTLHNVRFQAQNLPLVSGAWSVDEISGSFAWWPVMTQKTIETTPVLRGLHLQLDLNAPAAIAIQTTQAKKTTAYQSTFPTLEISQGEITLLLSNQQIQLHRVRARISNFEQLLHGGAGLQLASFWQDSGEQLSVSGNILIENNLLRLHQLQMTLGKDRGLIQGAFALADFSPRDVRITTSAISAQSLMSWLFPGQALEVSGNVSLDATLSSTNNGTHIAAAVDASEARFSFAPWLQQSEHYPLTIRFEADRSAHNCSISNLQAELSGMKASLVGNFSAQNKNTWKSEVLVSDLRSAKVQAPFLAVLESAENVKLTVEQSNSADPAQLGTKLFQLSMSSANVLGNQLSSLEARGLASATQLALTNFTATWLGGKLNVGGEYRFQDKSELKLNLTGTELSLVQWPQLKGALDASANLVVQLNGSGFDLPDAFAHATWEGSILAERVNLPQLKLEQVFAGDTIDFLNHSRSLSLADTTVKQLTQLTTPQQKLHLDFFSSVDGVEVSQLHLEDEHNSFESKLSIANDETISGSGNLLLNPSLSQALFEKPEWYHRSANLSGKLAFPISWGGKLENIVLRPLKNELLALLVPQGTAIPAPTIVPEPATPSKIAPEKAPEISKNGVVSEQKPQTPAQKNTVAPKSRQNPKKPNNSELIDEESLDDILKVIIR